MNRDKGTVDPCGDPSRSMGQQLGPFIHLMYEDGKSINKKNNLVARVGKPHSSSAVAAGFWHMAPIILKALYRQGLAEGESIVVQGASGLPHRARGLILFTAKRLAE